MIVDASVVAKWFLRGEEWEAEALEIRRKFEEGKINLLAPSLLIYEVGNVIWKRKDIPKDLAVELVRKIVEYLKEIVVELNPNFAKRALVIARNLNITFYDAVYIALAEERKEVLVTADKKLYEKAKSEYLVKFINEVL